MERQLFICKCEDPEHQFIITDDGEEIYLEILLNSEYNIFKRIWIALKYICGRKSCFGYFDEIIIKPEDANRLQRIINLLRTRK